MVGCDASGKTTMLHKISESYGDIAIESTKSAEAIEFKRANFNRIIDMTFVDERESLYLSLGQKVMRQTKQMEMDSKSTVSSDATLVTRLSHGIMRTLIGNRAYSNEAVITLWREDEEKQGITMPDIILLTSPPFEVIKERIIERQKSGQKYEAFEGFNSLEFLKAYYDGWLSLLPTINQIGASSIIIDTSITTPQESLEIYAQCRPSGKQYL